GSSSHSSLDHSSSRHSISGHSLSGHTPLDTTNADSSTPQRFVHRSLARTTRRSSSFERSLDSSLPYSRPSCKRCRSSTASVPSPTYDSRLIAPTPADLLPPRKRFRDSYSSEDSGEEHMELDTADVKAVADIEASAADMKEIIVDPLAIVIVLRLLEELVASGERASLVERIGSLKLEYLMVRAMLRIERDRIDSIRWHTTLLQEEFRQVRRDCDDTRRRLRWLESYVERHLGFLP
ncbi:hypothetical protein Tco_1528105, partial [Tanacetum coccineum]